jgi:hypothetical protein
VDSSEYFYKNINKMKKILFFALLFCLVGCTFEGVGVTQQVITIKVKANDWTCSQLDNNNYYYVGLNVPELTSNVFNRGEVKAYLVYDRHDVYNARKHALPYVMHKEEFDVAQRDWVFYTETFDFTYGIGWVEFNFRMSDFAYEIGIDPGLTDMEFDVVITRP